MLDPSTTSRARAWVEVRLDRIRENAAAIRRSIGPGAGLVPMVKAEAYGLGMVPVAAALTGFPDAADPWAFGVAAVSEGEGLRAGGWGGRILVFTPTPPSEYSRAVDAELTLCVSEVEAVSRLAAEAAKRRRVVPFHVEIDTGMGRAGLAWQEASSWGPAILERSSGLKWEGILTHFHSADEADPEPTSEQWARFGAALEVLPRIEPAPVLHVANSAAALRFKGFGCNLARPGIYLYGGAAGAESRPAPVVSVRARLVLVRDVPIGATAGYGATYRATHPSKWGTLSIGYGDGIPRSLSPGGGEALVHGQRVPILGRVSMDMITVDLSDVPEARVGDVCTLIGEDGLESIALDEVAQRCATISFEILTRLGTRLPRIYYELEPDDAE
ncbi:MAG: alanine racemase [Gemmatimonas sp.]|nr:alanine racemase [Gemmatimonas sp.]